MARKWTLETCRAEARKHETRGAFRQGSPSAHTSACKYGYLDAICSHMKLAPNIKRRFVYEIVSVVKKSAYVGITYQPDTRYLQHMRHGSEAVRAIISAPHRFCIVSEMVDVDEAVRLERDLIADYLSCGYDVANSTRGGELGYRRRRFTKQECLATARQHKVMASFYGFDRAAYDAARRRGWLDECCAHIKRRPVWTFEQCQKEAARYTNMATFREANKSAYNAASKHGWLDCIGPHLARGWEARRLRVHSVSSNERGH